MEGKLTLMMKVLFLYRDHLLQILKESLPMYSKDKVRQLWRKPMKEWISMISLKGL